MKKEIDRTRLLRKLNYRIRGYFHNYIPEEELLKEYGCYCIAGMCYPIESTNYEN